MGDLHHKQYLYFTFNLPSTSIPCSHPGSNLLPAKFLLFFKVETPGLLPIGVIGELPLPLPISKSSEDIVTGKKNRARN